MRSGTPREIHRPTWPLPPVPPLSVTVLGLRPTESRLRPAQPVDVRTGEVSEDPPVFSKMNDPRGRGGGGR